MEFDTCPECKNAAGHFTYCPIWKGEVLRANEEAEKVMDAALFLTRDLRKRLDEANQKLETAQKGLRDCQACHTKLLDYANEQYALACRRADELKVANLQVGELRKLLRRCFDAISQDGWPDLSLEVLAASKGDLTEKRKGVGCYECGHDDVDLGSCQEVVTNGKVQWEELHCSSCCKKPGDWKQLR